MSLINGLTSILKGSGNDSIDGINVYVTNSTAIPVEDENLKAFLQNQGLNISSGQASGSSSINVKMDPSPSDFTSMKSLNEIVPNGFILIHNDIEDLKEVLSSSGGSGGGLSSLLKGGIGGLGGIAGNFLGGAVVGLAQGLFTGVFGDKTTDHMQDIIDELNMDLIADDFRGDPEVEAAQHDAFIQYLKVYYSEQTASMAGAATGSFISETVVSAVKGILKGAFEILTLGAFDPASKLESIATELDKELTYESIRSNSEAMKEVKQIQADSVISYLKWYYQAQINEIGGESVGNAIGGALKGILNGVIEGIFGSFLDLFGVNNEVPEKLEDIAIKLTENINPDDFKDDPEVVETQRNAVLKYLKWYYQAQINELSGESVGNAVGGFLEETLAGIINGIFGSFIGLFKDNDKEPQKLEEVAIKLTENIDTAELSQDETVKSLQKDAVVKYLSIYYQSQIDELENPSDKSWFGNLTGKIGGAINNFWTNLLGVDESANSQFMVAVGKISEVDPDQFSNMQDIVDVKKNAIKTVVEQLLKIEGEAIVDHYKVKDGWFSGYKDKVNKALEGFADAYLTSISNAIGYTENANAFNASVNSMSPSNDVGIIRGNVSTMNVRINNIYTTLQQILANMTPSVIAIPTGEGESDEALLG